MSEKQKQPLSEPTWCILELMGHVVMAGLVVDETVFGRNLIRIDHPETTNGEPFTQYVSPDALYRITPTTEEVAMAIAENRETQSPIPYSIRRKLLDEPTIIGDNFANDDDFIDDDDDIEYEDDYEHFSEPIL